MSQPGRFDDFLYSICNETGGLEGLLNNIFDFMYRRTDFFYECDPGDKMGFPPGQNVNIMMKIFGKFQDLHYKTKQPRKDPKQFQEKLKIYKEKLAQKQEKQLETSKQQQLNKEKEDIKIKREPEEVKEKEIKNNIDSDEQQYKNQIQQQNEQKQNQDEKSQIDNFENTQNGGKTEKYAWSQNINDVQVEILLPETGNKKQLQIDMKNESILVKFKGETLLEGDLFLPIKIDDSLWSLEDGKKLTLTMEKAQENIWKTVIKGDKEIDTTKVQNTKPLESFDGETQGAIRKIMYDQQRKQMGLPTSEEESQIDMMKKAWDAEGSPFKGQPFDPSKFNVGQGGLNPNMMN